MDTGLTGFDARKTAQNLIEINDRNITKDTISGFGMKAKAAALMDSLRCALFPNIYDTTVLSGDALVSSACGHLKSAAVLLDCMIAEVLVNRCEARKRGTDECDQCREQAHRLAIRFMEGLPAIARILDTDIGAAYDGDPAALSRRTAACSLKSCWSQTAPSACTSTRTRRRYSICSKARL